MVFPAVVSAVTSDPASAARNPIGIYGKIAYVRMGKGKALIKRYPTEVLACKHLLDPNHPLFTPMPPRPERYKIHCIACGEYQWPEAYHRDASKPWRLYRRNECKACRKKRREDRLESWGRATL